MRRSNSFRYANICIVCLLLFDVVIILFQVDCIIPFVCAQAAEVHQPKLPKAVDGQIDASTWDFTRSNLALHGEWEIYFGELLEPTDFSAAEALAAPRPSGYVTVPGSWQTAKTANGPLPRHGVATYRLLVTGLPPVGDTTWALEVPYARTAYRLWANGIFVASNGTVSLDPAEMRPQYRPLVVPLPSTLTNSTFDATPSNDAYAGATLELVMQISNADFRSGGIPKNITFGIADRVARERDKRLISQMLLTGAIGLMSIFHLMMYAWRPTEKSGLYFALLSGDVAVRTFFTGESPVATVFPDFPWELQLKIEYITAFLGPPAFVLFLYSLFPLDMSRCVKRFWLAVGAIGVVLALILPVRHSSLFIPVFTGLVALLIPYTGYVLVRAAWKKREASELTLVGGVVFLTAVVLTMFHYNQLWIDLDWVPFGIFALLVSQALALSRRYALAFRRTTELAHQNGILLEETRRQLSERKRLHRLLTQQDEQTRREIAELLHGRAQARLFAASQSAAEAAEAVAHNPQEAARLMHSVRRMLEQVREKEIRDASHRLHPAAIRAGLIGALDSLCGRWHEYLNVDLSVDPDLEILDDPAESQLEENLRLGLYRIVEEALNNIYRHADAERVQVVVGLTSPQAQPKAEKELSTSLSFMDHSTCSLELTIVDDGKGFDPKKISPGLGLQLIAARTADLNGEWHITSDIGHGTTLRVLVPLESPQNLNTKQEVTFSDAVPD